MRNDKGFVLPLSIMLMLLLTVSGFNFMFFGFTEMRLTRTEVDNHGAFYLANTGIERARETFKLPPEGNWTSVLEGTYDGPDADTNPDYPIVATPVYCETCLCGPLTDPPHGCVIPSFGDPVTSGIPFAGTFDAGQYEVRAFNNEPGTVDTDQALTYRARGTVRGQVKLLELRNVEATTGLRLVTCQNCATSAQCPDKFNDKMTLEYMEGREPASTCELPAWDQDYYRDPANLPCSQVVTDTTGTPVELVTGSPGANQYQLQDGTCYFITGNVTVQSPGSGWDHIVIFSDGNFLVNGGGTFGDSIFIALNKITLQGNITLSSPKTPDYMPALISGGDITKGDASVIINGSIYAEGSVGDEQHPWNPNQVTGVIIGSDVYFKAAATNVSDAGDPEFYKPMPGFTYPKELLGNSTSGVNSWRELQ